MAKLVVCQTVICKVNGITLLRLDTNGQKANNARDATEEHLKFDISNGVDDEPITITAANDDNEAKEDNYDEQYEPMAQSSRNVFEMETVDTSIESVRQYVQTTRKNGKVWHQCRWNRTNSEACSYGSKWSGAMVNHIRSHLGIKPFRCPFCDKLFTIACNLKNHLRIHHGLKTKIILNGGRRSKGSIKTFDTYNDGDDEEKSGQKLDEEVIIETNEVPKLRVFKPSFVNGKANNAYAQERRVLPKRNVKKSQKYVDFEEDFDDNDIEDEKKEFLEMEVNEEEAEEKTQEQERLPYERTVKVEPKVKPQVGKDEEMSQFVTRRQYNKVLWWVCLWSPRLCKYRSHEKQDVLNHVKKHKNLNQFVCNDCGLSFANRQVLDSHQLTHQKNKFLKCNHSNCAFQTINETTMKMHKIRHKRLKN